MTLGWVFRTCATVLPVNVSKEERRVNLLQQQCWPKWLHNCHVTGNERDGKGNHGVLGVINQAQRKLQHYLHSYSSDVREGETVGCRYGSSVLKRQGNLCLNLVFSECIQNVKRDGVQKAYCQGELLIF
eukprot:1332000-Amphidinium_carterae.3